MTSSPRLLPAPRGRSRACRVVLGAVLAATAAFGAAGPAAAQPADLLRIGAAAVATAPRAYDARVPAAPHVEGAMQGRAAPTNQWYSTLLYGAQPEPVYAQPLTFRPTLQGLEVALPKKEVVPTERRDVEIHYTHRAPIVVAPLAFAPTRSRVAGVGDWSVDVAMGSGGDRFDATLAHGSPFAWLQVSRGDVQITLPAAGTRVDAGDERAWVVDVQGTRYLALAPRGARWHEAAPGRWTVAMPPGAQRLVVGALPDAQPATQALLLRHAASVVTGTRVDWQVDGATNTVTTTFSARSQPLDAGAADPGPLLGLYPHHWVRNASVQGRLGPAFDTVRGPLKLLAASRFQTTTRHTGFVPWWPAVETAPERLAQLQSVMARDIARARPLMLEVGKGPYWQGKGLQRILKLLDVAEQHGTAADRERLLGLVRTRLETWFAGTDRKNYFHWDRTAGTVVAYPEEYFAVEQMNDHHFHYGYWIRAAAEVALRDPAWAAKERWGGIVDLLVRDIANADRSDPAFPFLRNFDPYEGHSWASGLGLGAHGNNQESSSEALNAWVGLMLWGAVTGDARLRDLGTWLLATETASVQHYWFDLDRVVFAPEYRNPDVSMVFGGKYAHNTWWIDEPRQITGINLLPITTASSYLAQDPGYIRRNLAALEEEQRVWASRLKQIDPPDIWQDIFAKYRAFADPEAALAAWDRWGAVEFGDTRTHTLHFIASLAAMGPPDLSFSADAPFFQVFRRADGQRTYLAFNADATPRVVTFSDGVRLSVPPRQLARTVAR